MTTIFASHKELSRFLFKLKLIRINFLRADVQHWMSELLVYPVFIALQLY